MCYIAKPGSEIITTIIIIIDVVVVVVVLFININPYKNNDHRNSYFEY